MPRLRLLVPALVAAVAVAGGTPSVANAMPCWNKVIHDWTDNGKIDGDYSPRCYRQALHHVPPDLAAYSSIIDDINAALLDALGIKNGSGGNGNRSGGPGAPQPGGMNGNGRGRNDGTGNGQGSKVVPHAGTAGSIPDHSRSIPLPLIVLGAVLAAAALAAGSPPLVKRFRARFPRLRPAAGSVRPPA